jgi:lipoprotein-anchoring transpeptidase ErfK/SrfK
MVDAFNLSDFPAQLICIASRASNGTVPAYSEVCDVHRICLGIVSRAIVCSIALAGASCTDTVHDAAPPPDSQPQNLESVSPFQQSLDRHGVPLSVPQSGKAIVVNVPAFQLIAFEDGSPVMRSRIIVGTPWNRTPLIETYTTAIRIRPTWRPTPAMIASGEYVDRRWPAGPKNPLGLAAIRLEPGLLVYLHDTNRRGLFDKPMRALSHGCIRVQQWDDLAAWILDVDHETIHRWANGKRTFDVPTPNIPVLITYLTAFPDGDDRLELFEDIYSRQQSSSTEGETPDVSSLTSETEVAEATAARCVKS